VRGKGLSLEGGGCWHVVPPHLCVPWCFLVDPMPSVEGASKLLARQVRHQSCDCDCVVYILLTIYSADMFFVEI